MQCAGAAQNIEDLLRILMDVERRSFFRFQHDQEGLGNLRFRSIHYQIVGMSGEPVTNRLPGAEDVLQWSRRNRGGIGLRFLLHAFSHQRNATTLSHFKRHHRRQRRLESAGLRDITQLHLQLARKTFIPFGDKVEFGMQ